MSAKWKVVITDHRFPNVNQERKILAGIGAELVEGQAKTEEEIIQMAKDAHGILNARSKITPRVIDALQQCRIIVRYGIGVDTIDIPAATRKGIMVSNVPDYCIDEVSDHALVLILCLARKVVFTVRRVAAQEWSITNLRPLRRLAGQTVGVVGYGRIGRTLARKVKCLGFQPIAYDPLIKGEDIQKDGVQPVSLENLLRESDFISLHAPLIDSTRGMIGKEQFGLMKPTACLVNVSRGPLIDEGALIRALQEKRIAGAGLDVLVEEPPDFSNPLLKMENVIVTSHTAWYSEEAVVELQQKAAQRIADALSGKIPQPIINPDVLKGKK
jgi:D-3-phosphoglycerate dehydrogenase